MENASGAAGETSQGRRARSATGGVPLADRGIACVAVCPGTEDANAGVGEAVGEGVAGGAVLGAFSGPG